MEQRMVLERRMEWTGEWRGLKMDGRGSNNQPGGWMANEAPTAKAPANGAPTGPAKMEQRTETNAQRMDG
jgi:hypothetical protein